MGAVPAIKCSECGGTALPRDHAAWCSTGLIADLRDENRDLRTAIAEAIVALRGVGPTDARRILRDALMKEEA